MNTLTELLIVLCIVIVTVLTAVSLMAFASVGYSLHARSEKTAQQHWARYQEQAMLGCTGSGKLWAKNKLPKGCEVLQ